MSRPIEEGCLAIVVDGACPNDPDTNIGKIVKVGKFIGNVSSFLSRYTDYWEVDKPMRTTHERDVFYARQNNLQRIDDTDTETTTATTDMPAEVGV